MLTVTLLTIWLVIARAPDTPVARLFRHCLVERPAYWINRIRRGHVLLVLAALIFTVVAVVALDNEGVHILAMMAPEMAGWAVMFDVGTYLDVFAALAMASVVVRVRAVRGYIGSRLLLRKPKPIRRASRVAHSRPTAHRPAANDDSDGHGLRLVA